STVEAPYSRYLHSRFHYSRIEKMRSNSYIRGLRFPYSRIESKYRCVHVPKNIHSLSFVNANVSPITPYKLPFHIHGFCIRGIFTERIPPKELLLYLGLKPAV
ncbi:hypothetical protein SFRURICE_007942, partial [Spodoptera frugiperda]